MAACVSVVEAEEALLQIYALQVNYVSCVLLCLYVVPSLTYCCFTALSFQWRAIELRSQQLQNQCRQVELDEELDREERDLLREHEQLLRMKEKQLVQQQYEDRFKLRMVQATARKMQQQQSEQMREGAVAEASATVSIATITTKTTTETKHKGKAKVAAGADDEKKSKKNANAAVSKTNGDGDVVKRKKKKDVTKSVAFSPRKQAIAAISQTAPTARRRSLEESFNEENEPDVMNKSASNTSAADELMRMLSQDKGSDSEDDEASIGNLLLSFSPAMTSSERRYGSPSKIKLKETSNDTPSKFTPSKLARSVVKKAMAAPVDFDFTRRAELARTKAAKEKQQAAKQNQSDDDGSDEETAAATETPSKKALKRRKDLGISLSARPIASSKAATKSASAGAASSARGGKSLMQMVSAASLVEAKLSKPKETSTLPKKSAAAASEQGKPPLPENDQAKEPAKPKQKDKPTKETKSDSAEPEDEEFIGIQAANITKRAKPKQSAKIAKAKSAPAELTAEPEAEEDAVPQKKADKPKKKDKLSAVEQAIAKADMLTRMSKMQDIATPKVAGKKTKKVLKKTTMTALAAKRAEFQKILADSVTTDAAGSRDTDRDDVGEDSGAFETPRKARTMKRKRAEDMPGQGGVEGLAKKTAVAQAPQNQTNYLQSPSVAALLAMRPSKSPIGIRYVPKTPKTPQIIQSRKQPTNDDDGAQNPAGGADAQGVNAGLPTRAKKKSVKAARNAFAGTTGALTSVAGGLWGNSGPSFFDAFVNGGAPRLKRSAQP